MMAQNETVGLERIATCRVFSRDITNYRSLVRTTLPPSKYESVASPIHPFLVAWSLFDRAVSTLTRTQSPTVVHLGQDIVQRRRLEAEELTLFLDVLGARQDRRGVHFSFLTTICDSSGSAVCELVTRLLALDAVIGESFGDTSSSFVPVTEEGCRTTQSFSVPHDFPARYAEISKDLNPIHLDLASAQKAGMPGVVMHGMSVLAIVAELAIDSFAGGDPALIRGIGTRFSAPVLPGEHVDVTFNARSSGVSFQCRTARGIALKGGWIDVAPR